MNSLSDARIAIVGGGKMGEAVLGGWIAAKTGPAASLCAQNFVVANPGDARRAYLQETYGVSCVASASEISHADLVVLAVKPQVMKAALASLSRGCAADCALFVSVAAGLSTGTLESLLPVGAHVVRTMPNTPLLVGCGATAVAGGAYATEREIELVRDLFDCLGMACVVDEEHIDAIGAISGSGPAYVAALIEALAAAGARFGLDASLAERLATQTVRGTAELMVRKSQDAETTRIAVCSPGGTTLAALAAMDKAGFASSLDAGVEAAIRRSKELAEC